MTLFKTTKMKGKYHFIQGNTVKFQEGNYSKWAKCLKLTDLTLIYKRISASNPRCHSFKQS